MKSDNLVTNQELVEKVLETLEKLSPEQKAQVREQMQQMLQPSRAKPCRRKSGSLRAHFRTKEEAEQFAANPVNHPTYLNDVAHLCHKCGWWHLSRPEWLAPTWDSLDATVIN